MGLALRLTGTLSSHTRKTKKEKEIKETIMNNHI